MMLLGGFLEERRFVDVFRVHQAAENQEIRKREQSNFFSDPGDSLSLR